MEWTELYFEIKTIFTVSVFVILGAALIANLIKFLIDTNKKD